MKTERDRGTLSNGREGFGDQLVQVKSCRAPANSVKGKVEFLKKLLTNEWFASRKRGTYLSISRINGTIDAVFDIKKKEADRK